MNTTAKTVAQAAFTIAKITVGMWVVLVVADLLTFYLVYSSTAAFLEGRGLSEYMAKFLGVTWSSLLILVMNRVLWAVVKRNHKVWVPWVGVVWGTGLLALYFLTASYIDSPFDPFSGKAQNYYVDQRGQIHMIGRSAVTGPNGEDVKPFDKAAAQKYEQQQKKRGLRPVSESRLVDKPWNPFQTKVEEPELQIQVESVELLPDRTIVRMSVQRTDPYKPGRFYRSTLNNKLVDGYGEEYRFQQDTVEYVDIVDADTHEPITPADGPNRSFWSRFRELETKYLKPKEVYRFESIYAPVPQDVESLELNDPRFESVDITYTLGPAKRRVAQRTEQEAKAAATARAQQLQAQRVAEQAELARARTEQARREQEEIERSQRQLIVEAHASRVAAAEERVLVTKHAFGLAGARLQEAYAQNATRGLIQLRKDAKGKWFIGPEPGSQVALHNAKVDLELAEREYVQAKQELEQVKKTPVPSEPPMENMI